MGSVKNLIIAVLIALVILFVVIFLKAKADVSLKLLHYDSFDFYSVKNGRLLKVDYLYPGQRAYILIYNLTGYKRGLDNKLSLSSIIRITTSSGISLISKRTILVMYSDFDQDVIPVVKIPLDFKGLSPGMYDIDVGIRDGISEKMYSETKTLIVNGKLS